MLAKNLTEWRKLVLNRDNYTCQICGQEGSIADHIKSSLNPILLLETNNGRSLCVSCHSKYGDRGYQRKFETKLIRKSASNGGYEISLPPDVIRNWLEESNNRVVQLLYYGLPFIVIAPLELKINKKMLAAAVEEIEQD